jgi:hypothetical protein
MIADGLDVENLRFKTSQPMTAQASKKKASLCHQLWKV